VRNRIYPREAWVLLPSFKPKQVRVVKKYTSFGGTDYGDVTESGRCYRLDELFDSKEAAITYGRAACDKQQADLDKRQQSIQKRREALRLASKEQ
jgi:hypothetical protein